MIHRCKREKIQKKNIFCFFQTNNIDFEKFFSIKKKLRDFF